MTVNMFLCAVIGFFEKWFGSARREVFDSMFWTIMEVQVSYFLPPYVSRCNVIPTLFDFMRTVVDSFYDGAVISTGLKSTEGAHMWFLFGQLSHGDKCRYVVELLSSDKIKTCF